MRWARKYHEWERRRTLIGYWWEIQEEREH
jgi:hypothetical protein